MPNRQRGLELVRMEFRSFLHAIVLLPAQTVRMVARSFTDHGLQQLAKRLLCCLGKSPSDGSCLKQAYRLIEDALAGTLRMFQGRAVPLGGINRRPKSNNSQYLSYFAFSKANLDFRPRNRQECTIFQEIVVARPKVRRVAFEIRLQADDEGRNRGIARSHTQGGIARPVRVI